MSAPVPEIPGDGQESVWAYPRPPRLEAVSDRITIVFNGVTIVDTTRAFRVLETSHPPSYYLPPADIAMDYLSRESTIGSICEWKGGAVYFTLAVNGRRAERVAWAYPEPWPGFEPLKDHLAFYAGPMDVCYVGDERVVPQPGGFYGGWITSRVVGPFKGIPESAGW
jgi:uncharacterized protein (DUF427 family)